MEQLPILCIRRGRIGSDQRLDRVGRENSTERRLRFQERIKNQTWAPHFSRVFWARSGDFRQSEIEGRGF